MRSARSRKVVAASRCWQFASGDVDVQAVDGVDVVHGVDGVAVFEASGCGVCGVFGDEFGSVPVAAVLECSFGFGFVHPVEIADVVVGEPLVEW
ncbi:hypothetical protein ACFVX3_19580 [Rhodococcus erythropolis]